MSLLSYSQESKDPMSIYITSNMSIYSFDKVSYTKKGNEYKFDSQSTFYPELGIEFIFNEEGMSKHGLSLNFRYFTMLYNLQINDYSILPSFLSYENSNVVYSWMQNFYNLGISYKYYINFDNSSSLFLSATLNWDYKTQYSDEPVKSDFNYTHNGVTEVHTANRIMHASNSFPNFLSFQLGYKYNINKKFEIGAFMDYKPFSELVASDEITRSEGDEILRYTKIEQYKKYLILSFAIKYRLDFK